MATDTSPLELKNTVLVIVGPTAAGKTALGVSLARRLGGAVISADSRQVYAELNIGTAKPRQAWRSTPHRLDHPDVIQDVPHFLLNISPLTELYTLASWQKSAHDIIHTLLAKGVRPIVVGGTMLYVDSLLCNYSIPLVPPSPAVRSRLEQLATEELLTILQKEDPQALAFIESHHRRRIIRALEVILVSGKPFSEQRRQQPSPFTFKVIGLFPGWEKLRDLISQRAHEMLAEGLIEETERLRTRYSPTLPLLQTLNYRQAMIQANMRYAHKQMAWWKKNPNIHWFDTASAAAAYCFKNRHLEDITKWS